MKRRVTTTGKASRARRGKTTRPKRGTAAAGARHDRKSDADLKEQVNALTRELTKAREEQTATSEVLGVISSSSGELEPVFKSMLANALRICEAQIGHLLRYSDGKFLVVAQLGSSPKYAEFSARRGWFKPHKGAPLDRLLQTRRVVQILDESSAENPSSASKLDGAKTHIAVPMLKDNKLVGAFFVYRREVRPFSDRHVELVQNFAAQAVIAIENSRLLSELRQRTDDLSELLEQQTATSEVLKVISSSPGDLLPVFQSMLQNSVKICEAKFGQMFLYEQEAFRVVANLNVPAALAEFQQGRGSFQPRPGGLLSASSATSRFFALPMPCRRIIRIGPRNWVIKGR